MTSQELATINELDLPILICIINNSSLRIIKQWQENILWEMLPNELENPDFIKTADAYHIPAMQVDSPGEVSSSVQIALSSKNHTSLRL